MRAAKVYFVLGGPGSGKGTQCSLLEKKKKNIHHISAGDCLREERNDPNSKYGQLINRCIKEGTIVPVEITCGLLKKRMDALNHDDVKFLIDGFPRNQNNLDGWNEFMKDVSVGFCVHIYCSQEIMENRVLKRGEGSQRLDDNIDSILKRFHTYTTETLPIVEFFKSQGMCHEVDGTRTIQEVYEDLAKLF